MGVAYSGTPWSGQAVKWNCVTFKDRSELPVSCNCVYVCMHVCEQIANQLYER